MRSQCSVRTIFLCWLASMLVGCANQYKEFYKPIDSDSLNNVYQNRELPPTNTPLIERVSSSERHDTRPYIKRGYTIIGQSSFHTGREENENSAFQLAQEVQADLVVVMDPRYLGSQTAAIPLTTPTSTTSYSTGTATAYGPRGMVNIHGSGTTTTFGSVTNMIPVTIHRSEYSAAFFVKTKVGNGVWFRDMNDDERRVLQTNRGSVIDLVVDGGTVFKADLLVGDVITEVNGIQIESTNSLLSVLKPLKGQRVVFKVNRNGSIIEKTVYSAN